MGKNVVDTWYYSPYPEPYASRDMLYICEFTLKYFSKKKTLLKHTAKLQQRHPPGSISAKELQYMMHQIICHLVVLVMLGGVPMRSASVVPAAQ